MDSRAKNLIIQSIPALKDLSNKFLHYQNATVDLQRIVYFISQFDTYDKVAIIIRLINKIDFIDSNRMTYLLKKAYDKLPLALKETPIISSLGSIQDSSAVVCYQLLKQLFDKETETLSAITEVNSVGKIIESKNITSIIFFDDNITSGTQLVNFFDELMEGKSDAELVKIPLTKEQSEIIKTIPIRVCYAIQLDEESNEKVKGIRLKHGIDLEIYSGKVDFDNHLDFQSGTVKDESEAIFTKQFITEISFELYQDKSWSHETIYSRLLGYGNLGKLTVFYYNVPKSFVPVFWKLGEYNGKPWIPLFPESQEQKKANKKNITYNFFQLEAINSWINSLPQNRKPNITFGFEGNGKEITLEIPSINFVQKHFEKYLTFKKIEYEKNQKQRTIRDINLSHLNEIYPTDVLNARDYSDYKNTVDDYNKKHSEFFLLKKEYILRQSSNVTISIITQNIGNSAATNSMIKLFYNSAQLLIHSFDNLKLPAFDEAKPSIDHFDSANIVALPLFVKNKFDDLFNSISKRDPVENDTNYYFRILYDRIGHNDTKDERITITRMNLEKYYFEIPYEINFDQEAETIKGVLKINYKEVEKIDKTIEHEIYKSIDKLK